VPDAFPGKKDVASNGGSKPMPALRSLVSHAAVGGATAVTASVITYLIMANGAPLLAPSAALAQAIGPAIVPE
jgi:hypothetical protein